MKNPLFEQTFSLDYQGLVSFEKMPSVKIRSALNKIGVSSPVPLTPAFGLFATLSTAKKAKKVFFLVSHDGIVAIAGTGLTGKKKVLGISPKKIVDRVITDLAKGAMDDVEIMELANAGA